jgi:thiamine monophosphate synthase
LPGVSWLFFKVRAKRPYLNHTGRASNAEKQPTGPGPEGCDQNDIPLIATGGIGVSNASLYFQVGADAIGVGSALIPSENRDDLIQQCAETARKLLASQ